MHAFLSNLANRQTDRHRGQLHLPPLCIGDDTKAAARQSLNCIKNKKNDEKRFSICRMEFLHPAMGTITTLISSGDCTLQCGMWLWNRDSEFTK